MDKYLEKNKTMLVEDYPASNDGQLFRYAHIYKNKSFVPKRMILVIKSNSDIFFLEIIPQNIDFLLLIIKSNIKVFTSFVEDIGGWVVFCGLFFRFLTMNDSYSGNFPYIWKLSQPISPQQTYEIIGEGINIKDRGVLFGMRGGVGGIITANQAPKKPISKRKKQVKIGKKSQGAMFDTRRQIVQSAQEMKRLLDQFVIDLGFLIPKGEDFLLNANPFQMGLSGFGFEPTNPVPTVAPKVEQARKIISFATGKKADGLLSVSDTKKINLKKIKGPPDMMTPLKKWFRDKKGIDYDKVPLNITFVKELRKRIKHTLTSDLRGTANGLPNRFNRLSRALQNRHLDEAVAFQLMNHNRPIEVWEEARLEIIDNLNLQMYGDQPEKLKKEFDKKIKKKINSVTVEQCPEMGLMKPKQKKRAFFYYVMKRSAAGCYPVSEDIFYNQECHILSDLAGGLANRFNICIIPEPFHGINTDIERRVSPDTAQPETGLSIYKRAVTLNKSFVKNLLFRERNTLNQMYVTEYLEDNLRAFQNLNFQDPNFESDGLILLKKCINDPSTDVDIMHTNEVLIANLGFFVGAKNSGIHGYTAQITVNPSNVPEAYLAALSSGALGGITLVKIATEAYRMKLNTVYAQTLTQILYKPMLPLNEIYLFVFPFFLFSSPQKFSLEEIIKSSQKKFLQVDNQKVSSQQKQKL